MLQQKSPELFGHGHAVLCGAHLDGTMQAFWEIQGEPLGPRPARAAVTRCSRWFPPVLIIHGLP